MDLGGFCVCYSVKHFTYFDTNIVTIPIFSTLDPFFAFNSQTICLSSFILGMQGLCKELFHPAKFCLHCSYAYEAKAAFLLENGKHESGAWVALQPVSFSQQLARVSPEGPSL